MLQLTQVLTNSQRSIRNYFFLFCFCFLFFFLVLLVSIAYKLKYCVKSVRIRSYSGPHFPACGLNTERYCVSLRIHSECGKISTGITPNTDTFYAVKVKLWVNCSSYLEVSERQWIMTQSPEFLTKSRMQI